MVCSAAGGHNGTALSDKPMSQPNAWRMIRRRAGRLPHFRATRITVYLADGGALEHAQEMAAHENLPKDQLTQDEVERIRW
jgi:hypothetical protein